MRSGAKIVLLGLLMLALPGNAAAASCSPEAGPINVRPDGKRIIDIGCPAGVLAGFTALHGTVTADPVLIVGGRQLIRYEPTAGYVGPDTISFSHDGDPVNVGVTVAPGANSPPRCPPLEIEVGVAENGIATLTCYEPDVADPVTFEGVTAAALGTVTVGTPAAASGLSHLPLLYTLGTSAGANPLSDAFSVSLHEDVAMVTGPTRQAPVGVNIPADTPPVCPGVNRSTQQATAFAFQLACSDPDPGDALAYALAAPALHATMALDGSGAGSYAPTAAFSGGDLFQYTASDGRAISPPARFDVNVIKRPGPTPPGKRFIRPSYFTSFALGPSSTRVDRLTITGIPAAGAVQLRCTGRGCPFRIRTARPARGGVAAAALFKRRGLAAGTTVVVRVTASGYVGSARRFRMRSRRAPVQESFCLMPGSSVLRKAC